MAPQVFISYSSLDVEFAQHIHESLEGAGISSWWAPASLRAGEEFARVIAEQIPQCSVFVLLWSKNAAASEDVQREIGLAGPAKLLLVPILLDDTGYTSKASYYFKGIHRVSWNDLGRLGVVDTVQRHLKISATPYPLHDLYYQLLRDPDNAALHLKAVRLLVRFVAMLHVAQYVLGNARDAAISGAIEQLLEGSSLFVDFDIASRVAIFLVDRGAAVHPGFADFFQLPVHAIPTAQDFEDADDAAEKFDLENLPKLCGARTDLKGTSPKDEQLRQLALCASVRDFVMRALTQEWIAACRLSYVIDGAESDARRAAIEWPIERKRLPEDVTSGVRLLGDVHGADLELSPYFVLVPGPAADVAEIALLSRQGSVAEYVPVRLDATVGCERPPIGLPWGRLVVQRQLPRQVFIDESHVVTLQLTNDSADAVEIDEITESLPENLVTPRGSRTVAVARALRLERGESRALHYEVVGAGLPGATRSFSAEASVVYRYGQEKHSTLVQGPREVTARTIPHAGVRLHRRVLDAHGAVVTGELALDGEYTVDVTLNSCGRALPEMTIEDDVAGAIVSGSPILWRGPLERVDRQAAIRLRYTIRAAIAGSLSLCAKVTSAASIALEDEPVSLIVVDRPPPELAALVLAADRSDLGVLNVRLAIDNRGGTGAYDVHLTSVAPDGVGVEIEGADRVGRIAPDEQAVMCVHITAPPLTASEVGFRLYYRSITGDALVATLALPLGRVIEGALRSLPTIGRPRERRALHEALCAATPRLICVYGEHGVGRSRLVHSELDLLRREGLRVQFHEVECDPSRGLTIAVAILLEQIVFEGAANADRGSRADIVAFLGSVGMDEENHRGPINVLVDLIQRSGSLNASACDAVGRALAVFVKKRGLDRLVLVLRGISAFTRQELAVIDALAKSQRTPEVRLVLTADKTATDLGLDTCDVEIGRFTSDDCLELIDRVFLMPRASDRLRRELIELSECIPANLFSLLRRLVDDQDSQLDFRSPLGVDVRDPRWLRELPTTFQEAEARAASLTDIPRLVLACFAALDEAIQIPALLEMLSALDPGIQPDRVRDAIQLAQDRQWFRADGRGGFTPTSNTVRRALAQAAGLHDVQKVHEAQFAIHQQRGDPVDVQLSHLVACRPETISQNDACLAEGLRQLVDKGQFSQTRSILHRLHEILPKLPTACEADLAVIEQELRWEETGDLDPAAFDSLAPRIARVAPADRRAALQARVALILSRWHSRKQGDHRRAIAVAEGALHGVWLFRHLQCDNPRLEFEFQLNLWELYYRACRESAFCRVDTWLWKHMARPENGAYDCEAIASFLRLFLAFQREQPDPEARHKHFAAHSAFEIDLRTQMDRLEGSVLQGFLQHPEHLNLENRLLFGRLCVDIGTLLADRRPGTPELDAMVEQYLHRGVVLFKDSGFLQDHAMACRRMADWCRRRLDTLERSGKLQLLAGLCAQTDRWLELAADGFAALHDDREHLEAVLVRAEVAERACLRDPGQRDLLRQTYEQLCALPALASKPDAFEHVHLALAGLYEHDGRMADAARALEAVGGGNPLAALHRALIRADSLATGRVSITDLSVHDFEQDLHVLRRATSIELGRGASNIEGPRIARSVGLIAWHLVAFERKGERASSALPHLRQAFGEIQGCPDLVERLGAEGSALLFDLWRMAGSTDDEMARDFSAFLLPVLRSVDLPVVEAMLNRVWEWEAGSDDAATRLAAAEMSLALCETTLDRRTDSVASVAMARDVLSRLAAAKQLTGHAIARLFARGLALVLRGSEPGHSSAPFLAEVTTSSDALETSGHPETALYVLVHLIELVLEMHRRTHNQWFYDSIVRPLAPRLGVLRTKGAQDLDTVIHLINLYLQLPHGITEAVDLMEEHCRRLQEDRDYADLPRYLSFLSDLLQRTGVEQDTLQVLLAMAQRDQRADAKDAAVETAGDKPELPEELKRELRIQNVARQLCRDIIDGLRGEASGLELQRSVLYNAAKLLTGPHTADLRAAVYAKLFALWGQTSGSCAWSAYVAWSESQQDALLSLQDKVALTSFSMYMEESDDGRVIGSPRNYLINARERNRLLGMLAEERPDDVALRRAYATLELRRLSYLEYCARRVHESSAHRDEFEHLAWVTFLEGYLFGAPESGPMWQRIQRIQAQAAIVERERDDPFKELARSVGPSAESLDGAIAARMGMRDSGGEFMTLLSSNVQNVLIAARQRGQAIMTHLAGRARQFSLEDILGEVLRYLNEQGRSIDFGAVLGLWDSEPVDAHAMRLDQRVAQSFLDHDPRDLIAPALRSGLQLVTVDDPAAAEHMYRFALNLCERSMEPHPDLPIALHGLSISLRKQEKYADAREAALREVAVREARHDADLDSALDELAEVCIASGDPEAALPHLHRKLALDEARLGSDAIAFALQLNTAALTLRAAGHLEEAEAMLQRALAIDRAGQPEDSPTVPHRLYNLATLLLLQGKIERATAAVDEALGLKNGVRDVTTARLLFLKAVLVLIDAQDPEVFLRQLRTLLLPGEPLPVPGNLNPRSEFQQVLEYAASRLTPVDSSFITGLAAAINDCDCIAALDAHERWRTVAAGAPGTTAAPK